MKTLLCITVNGVPREEAVAGNLLLIEFLRDALGLTGTKMGCDGGDCGASPSPFDGEGAGGCGQPPAPFIFPIANCTDSTMVL